VQRAVEAAGIPTVALATLLDRVQWVRYPRAAIVKFPRGATCGPPHAADLQRAVLRDVFRLLETAREPGTVVELPHRFSEAA
jgi:D-proline reductase (dithiol) PrdB